MKILLFGNSGAIGTAMETVCADKKIDYVGLGHADVEVTNPDEVSSAIERHSPTVVINSVAVIGGNPCEEDPVATFNINAIAASYMAKACEKNGIAFVQPSSHAVFDGYKDHYYTEYDIPVPIGMYAASKYMSEVFAKNLCSRHYIIRFPTMFGPRRNLKPGFMDKVIDKMQKGESLKIADDKTDSPTYTLDVAAALADMLQKGTPYGVYHLANSGITTYYELVKKTMELLGLDVKLEAAKDSDFPALAHKPLKTAMKSAKLPPLRPWQDALADYVSTYISPQTG
ncbi:NAD(P)-dependent oxidoreductase [Candidatus Pacearchaeota archaeon]|nr:NAD(P)-dependent oxidoreductase [Candidatus Pacearchaeota archaeon]